MISRILVTGGLGFIGSHFLDLLLKNEEENVVIVNLDACTYAADISLNKQFEKHSNYKFIKGSITDRALLKELFLEYKFDSVFNFAAETHVDNSISGPGVFVDTNVMGTFSLLEESRLFWEANNLMKISKFLHVSTDEVYGQLGSVGMFTEQTPYAPNSPYSASKASSDFMVRSYHHTYGMNTFITNCSNNFGARQNDEKLIPTIVRKAINGEEIPIYGNGKNIRDWLFVEEHCEAIFEVFKKGNSGESYNIGSYNERTNINIAKEICNVLDESLPKKDGLSYSDQIKFVIDRKGHDFRYAIDASKIKKTIGWSSKKQFKKELKNTIDWYVNKYKI